MRTLSLPLLLILLLFSVASADQSFEHPSLGFSIKYPDDWTMRRQNFAAFLATYPGRNITEEAEENFRIEVMETSGNGGNSMIAEMDRRTIESSFPGLSLAKSAPTPLGNLKDGHRFDFEGKHGGQDYVLVRVMAFSGRTVIRATFSGNKENYKRHQSRFEGILRSFKMGA